MFLKIVSNNFGSFIEFLYVVIIPFFPSLFLTLTPNLIVQVN